VTRKINRHPHALERVAAQRGGIARQDDQGDQDIFAKAVHALGKR